MTREPTFAELSAHCPMWCDGDHPAFDQHMSTCWMCFIPLATDSSFATTALPTGAPAELQLYVEQPRHEADPRIVIEHVPTGQPKFSVMPTEAFHFSDALRRLATMAIDANKSVKCHPCDQHPI